MEWGRENWFVDIVNFRRNPSAYLSAKRLDEESFLVDVLQSFYSENVQNSTKIHLLSLLHEYSSTVCGTADSIEQTVATLQDVFHQTKSSSASNICYKGQILITCTSLLVASDQIFAKPGLFSSFLNLLLDVISKINSGGERVLRATACECLKEMETCYPGLLMKKLEHLYQMSQLENTHAFQSYVVLFVTVLNNGIQQIAKQGSQDVNILTQLLCHRTEPLKPVAIPDNCSELQTKGQSNAVLSSIVDTRELKRTISYIMELCPFLTTGALVTMVQQLMTIVEITPNLSASIFKFVVLKYLPTMDVSLFHLLFQLKLLFPADLCSEQESEELLNRLVISAGHPSLTMGHRLLLYEWLISFQEKQDNTDIKVDYTHFLHFFPRIFDGMDTQYKKLNMLSLCFTPGGQSDAAVATLMSSLVCLHKLVHYGIAGRAAVTLFQVLFLYYQRHQQSAVVKELQKFMLGVVIEHPKFAPYVLDLLDGILTIEPESTLPIEILSELTTEILSTQPLRALPDLLYHLVVLQRAAQEQDIQPHGILEFLLKLLEETSVCQQGDWVTGNYLLAVCRRILQYHNTRSVYVVFGNVLYTLFTQFEDMDIQDRAKFYYALLTNLSSDKVSTVLSATGSNDEASENLTSLVTGSANFPTARPVVHMATPALKLERVEDSSDIPMPSKHAENTTMTDTDLLLSYKNMLQSEHFDAAVKLKFNVFMHKDCTLDRLFAIVFHINPVGIYAPVRDVYISSLATKEICSSQHEYSRCIQLSFFPQEPVPTQVKISSVFTSTDGTTYASDLEPIQIKFRDFFLPIVIPECCDATKQELFHSLWEEITKQNSGDFVQSIWCCPSTELQEFSEELQSQLKSFIMSHIPPDGTLNIGILLPPKYHILFKVTDNKISIATDNWKILPMVSDWLNGLVKNKLTDAVKVES